MGKMEQQIDEIEDFLESCKAAAFSSNKIIVDKIQIEELLEELRSRIPNEIKQSQRLLQNKDQIINEANETGKDIIEDAKKEAQRLLDEHDIAKQARAIADNMMADAHLEAERIIKDAQREASDVRESAIAYTDSLLQNMENVLAHTLDQSQSRYGNLMNSLSNSLNVVKANRAELAAPATITREDTNGRSGSGEE